MDISLNSIQLLLTGLLFIRSISSLTLKTKDVIFEDGSSIILNCTYYKSNTEDISSRNIRWQKRIGNVFRDIAVFSPPGRPEPFITKEMHPFYINRTELIAPNISFSAVLIIEHPICTDQGLYRCWIGYYSDSSYKIQTSGSVVKFKSNPKEPEKFQLFPNKLNENQSISILCSAYVGSPLGNIKIWKISQYIDTPVLIHESKATTNETGTCTEFIDVHITYTVTRDDNGALFRCSSQTNLTQGPGPSRGSLRISVIYGPDKPVITLTPLKSFYFVGDHLTIQCITDSNPPPVFTWKFHPHNKSLETVIKTSSDVSKLVFDTLQTTDSGTYSCTATNTARLNSENVTSSVSLYVSHSEMSNQGCNQCGYLKVCQQYDGKTVCVTNKWVPIAIVFILISVSFAAASIVLIKNKSASEDDGGYQAHAEIVNTHVYSALQSHQPETGVYTTLQSHQPETGVYTSLQSHKPETGVYTSLQSHQPETGVYTSLQSHQPETGVYTSLQSHQPETGVYTSLQSHKPETGVYTSVQSHQPETGVYTSLQSHKPETGVYTSLQSHQPETGVYTSLQSHQPETGVYTSLQSQRPETGENASLQSNKPETGGNTSLQSHKPETGVYTALQSQRPETGEHASLQSHKPETGEYTSIDNVS